MLHGSNNSGIIKRPLYITINYSNDVKFVNEKIGLKKPSIVVLKSSKEKYNIKTYRIAEEMKKYGWKIRAIKYLIKKNPARRKVLKIMLTN